MKVIVIGAGIAGMAVALRLALKGHAVTVFEKNAYPGGKITIIERNGYWFDAGPSLFTQPQNIEELFALAGEDSSAYFHYQRIPITCKYFYEDGTIINAYADKDRLVQELYEKLGEDPQAVRDYLVHAQSLYKNIGEVFVKKSLHKVNTYFSSTIFRALAHTRYEYLFNTLNDFNTRRFRHPKTIQLFNRFATYNGSDPYKAPGMLSMIAHLEMNQGVYYPDGGIHAITTAIFELCKRKGVQFYFNQLVQRIVTEKNKATGVQANGHVYQADLVVSNIDVYFTYRYLLQNEERAQKVLNQERSSSALIFYWGMNRLFKELELHNIFFSNDYAAEFRYLFEKKEFYPDPTLYINISSKYSTRHAPAGGENWFVMVNAPANVGQDWTAYRMAARKVILRKLARILGTDIGAHITVEEVLDPLGLEQHTGSYQGSLYGTSSNGRMAAFFRHPNFCRQYKNLYYCGGSVHPGGGIPLCLMSARILSEMIPPAQQ